MSIPTFATTGVVASLVTAHPATSRPVQLRPMLIQRVRPIGGPR